MSEHLLLQQLRAHARHCLAFRLPLAGVAQSRSVWIINEKSASGRRASAAKWTRWLANDHCSQNAAAADYSFTACLYRVFQKPDTQFYFWDNFGNSAPISTILSLLQAEIYGA